MAHTSQDSDEIISGINVTPLVDIVLVLLIIFIVTASFVLKSKIPIELPKAASGEASQGGLLNLAVTREGLLYINGQASSLDGIAPAVAEARSRLSAGATVTAFVSADQGASYGSFAAVVDRLRLAGVSDIALDTMPLALPQEGP
ncbi:MAG: biopolymer transporter ExbD [Myxococcales bacterium]|nr:biopolymer transporter ExbD [Myxococcales bacterium]